MLTTHEMLMALEEMPPHTLYRAEIDELSSYPAPITVYRCDCLPDGAYVVLCNRLAPEYYVPCYWTARDDFLLDLGYRGVNDKMLWRPSALDEIPCDDPERAAALAAIREA